MSSQCQTNPPPNQLSGHDLYRRCRESDSDSSIASMGYTMGYTMDSTFVTSIQQTDAESGSDVPVRGTLTVPVQDNNAQGKNHLDRDIKSPHLCDWCNGGSPELCCFECDRRGCPYHEECWFKERHHRPRHPTHEVWPIASLDRLRYFNEPNMQTSIEDLKLLDDDGNCFVKFDVRNEKEKYQLGHRAFPLLPHGRDLDNKIQYPSFISFVGRTASGKSFLIRALQYSNAADEHPTPIPAPGANKRNHSSTSSDIHLYADPMTTRDESPILFLDCEGFEGSDVPRGVRMWMDGRTAMERKTHVEVAYPRFIHAFSTCIVFVTSGPLQESADIRRRLLSYASEGASGSRNQGFKPSLFLIFNHFRDGTRSDFDWSIKSSSEAFLASGHEAKLNEFYSSIHVIYIPSFNGTLPAIALKQIDAFNVALRAEHAKAFQLRQEFHLDFTPRHLQPFLHKALKHFSDEPDAPFDWALEAPATHFFLEEWELMLIDLWTQYLRYHSTWETAQTPYNLVHQDFRKHFTFCLRLMLSRRPPRGRRIADILDIWALQLKQLNEYVPCGASSADGLKCEKIRFRHGDYHESLTNKCSRWRGQYEARKFDVSQTFETSFKAELARSTEEKIFLRDLPTDTIPRDIRSIVTCLGCLQGPPSTVLACGHAFCLDCIRELMNDDPLPHRRKDIQCPIHREPQNYTPRLLPIQSGYRILSLDGGGVQGFAQLVMLREIESRCLEIPALHLFDLVVGTSIGGQIALALNKPIGSEPLTVASGMGKFRELMKASYQQKSFISLIRNTTKYKSKKVEHQLKGLFSEDTKLFSASSSSQSSAPNIAVTTVARTTVAKNPLQPYLISNYNRKPLGNAVPLLFGITPTDCMPVWAAARCTSAALPYFKPLEWQGHTLLDGGFMHNCPAACAYSEAKSIWPDKHCDILLSLGTGRARHPISVPRKSIFISGIKAFIDYILEADSGWHEFWKSLGEEEGKERIFRLNPEYDGTGFGLDDFRKLDEIERQATEWIATHNKELNDICDRLIAALFFFHPLGPIKDGVQAGEILCRLPGELGARQNLVIRMLQVQEAHSYLFEFKYLNKLVHINVAKSLDNLRRPDELRLKVDLPDLPAVESTQIHVKMRSLDSGRSTWSPISGSPYNIRGSI